MTTSLRSALLLSLVALCACNELDPRATAWMDNPDEARKVLFFANSTGTRLDNSYDRKPSEFLVSMIDQAQTNLDVCVYGFSKKNVYEAVIRAYYRGVNVRVVGDARHFGYGERGYRAIQQHRIPLQVGNGFHIMHNKFFVIDNKFTFVGTGNMTTTGFERNHNNWILIDSPQVAKDFHEEFNQMFDLGRFSNQKRRVDNGNVYEVGDTTVEVYFSPQEDTMGRLLEELDNATHSVHFQIFAFTKDQVGSRFIRLHRQFQEQNGADADLPVMDRERKVVGIVDKSQVHGNGQYHEIYRMMTHGIPMRIDANANSYTPGDYQAGGGRLHTKTMILDYGTPNARVVTGSFNWSSAATIANDEVLLVLRGERIVEQYMKTWEVLWKESLVMPDGVCSGYGNRDFESPGINELPMCGSEAQPGDVIFSEVHWDGWNGLTDATDRTGAQRDPVTNDEFIELYNTTDRPIDLSLWTISNGYDSIMGFMPGTVIQPGQYFLLLDHNTVPYSDVEPIRGSEAFTNPDYVLNMANDPRFPRLNLRNSSLRLQLHAPRDYTGANPPSTDSAVIDVAGNHAPPFFGGRVQDKTFSMERRISNGKPVASGDKKIAWKQCTATQGGRNVVQRFRSKVIATPGQANSE